MPTDPDHHYPDPDLVRAYIARRGVATFHVRAHPGDDVTACGRPTAELVEAGWARGLRRQGLNLCSACGRTVDLDEEASERPEEPREAVPEAPRPETSPPARTAYVTGPSASVYHLPLIPGDTLTACGRTIANLTEVDRDEGPPRRQCGVCLRARRAEGAPE